MPNYSELKDGWSALSGTLRSKKRKPEPAITLDAYDAVRDTIKSKSPISGESIGALGGTVSKGIDWLREQLSQQNFEPKDSMIASAAMHPIEGMQRGGEWLQRQMNTAGGMPDPAMQDEGSMYAYGPSTETQAQVGVNLAGMAQLGSMPMSPRSAGGTLGTMIKGNPGVSYRELGQGNPMFPRPQNSSIDEFGGRTISDWMKDSPGVSYRNMRKK